MTDPAPISVPRRPGGLAGAELAGRVDDHPDALGLDAEFLDGDLQRDRVHALAHLGPAVAHLDRSVVAEVDDRLGDLLEPVAEPGVLEPETDTDRLAGGDRLVVGGLDRVEALTCAEAAVVHQLARAPHLAGHHDVARRASPSR